jgi:hypothetical protein
MERPTAGRLVSLDLSGAVFSRGGDYYINKGAEGRFYPTSAHAVPQYLFRGCSIEHVVLPQGTDSLLTGAFELSHLRSITLPDHIWVGSWVFNGDSLLQTINFPKYVREIGQNNFNGSKALRTIRLGDIAYIPWGCFSHMPALESCTVAGDVMHFDGNPFIDCPRLRTVTFRGNVMSTGGSSLANKCPRLQTVTFLGNVMQCGFSTTELCPRLKTCHMRGAVLYGQQSALVGAISSKAAPEVTKSLVLTADKFLATDSVNPILSFAGSNVFYNTACLQALAGEQASALHFLARAVQYGYKGYPHIVQDSDLMVLHGNPQFEQIVQKVRQTGDMLYILRHSEPYDRAQTPGQPFTYDAPTDADLLRVRQHFNLDSIAGQGDEIARIKRIMYWLHDLIRHDGSGGFPASCPRNAIALSEACKAQGRGLNCRGLALVLSECYLAMGWPARALTCQSKAYDTDPDCHVICMVWSRTLHKWIWMDPTFAAYVTDENGLLLHPGEVRERLIDGRPLVLNDDANWNHQSHQTKESYLETYMAKNLYLMCAHTRNGFGIEGGNKKSDYIALTPAGMQYKWGTATHNDQYFWQPPKE